MQALSLLFISLLLSGPAKADYNNMEAVIVPSKTIVAVVPVGSKNETVFAPADAESSFTHITDAFGSQRVMFTREEDTITVMVGNPSISHNTLTGKVINCYRYPFSPFYIRWDTEGLSDLNWKYRLDEASGGASAMCRALDSPVARTTTEPSTPEQEE